METLFHIGKEIEIDVGAPFSPPASVIETFGRGIRAPALILDPHFALTGNSRSKTNSIMISVRATAEVFAAQ